MKATFNFDQNTNELIVNLPSEVNMSAMTVEQEQAIDEATIAFINENLLEIVADGRELDIVYSQNI